MWGKATLKDMESFTFMSWRQKAIWKSNLAVTEFTGIEISWIQVDSLDFAEYSLKYMGHSIGICKYVYFNEIS